MPPQAPWSPTAHAFAHHQFSHVANFWKQGRQASFRLEALPGGQAELNLTFRLPSASQVIPPPSHVSPVPAPQRPIHPLFPKGCSPQRSGAELASPSLQGSAKAIGGQCFTELPWLCFLFLLLRMVPYARLLKPVFSAFKSFQTCQGALKVPKRDPYLPLQVPIPPPFYL